MAYSGTVGTTIINVQKIIDHSARRAGKLAEELTVEQVQSAKESLFYVLSNLINQGIQYWAIDKVIYGLNLDQAVYYLPVGGNDVLNALYRTMDRPTPQTNNGYLSSSGIAYNAFDGNTATDCIQTSPNGYIGVNYGTNNSQFIASIGILPATNGTFTPVFEWSNDGNTWTELYSPGEVVWQNLQWLWYDIEPGVTAQYYRMRETGGGTMNVSELYFGTNARELQMSRLNRDDYTNLPNKQFEANQPYQYWFNRTIPQAQIVLWPTPNDPFVQMTVWYSRQIMDVGDLTDQLEIPDRWYMAIQNMHAHQFAQELPGVDLQKIQYLETQAEKYFIMAENEERDKSPIYFAPNISVYTR